MTRCDPKGLIREAYAMEGLGEAECRSIFIDWALSVEASDRATVLRLLEAYAGTHPDHPMTRTLQAALETPPAPRRRGGRKGRLEG